MVVDVTKLNFYSGYPIDKVVATGTATVVNDGATVQQPQRAKIITSSIANPYGKKCFVRFVWSVDGVNFNAADAHLIYTFTITTIPPAPATTTTLTGLQGGVAVGVNASTITFQTGSGYHGNVTDNGTVYTYTPTSQTFTIKYALFEILPYGA